MLPSPPKGVHQKVPLVQNPLTARSWRSIMVPRVLISHLGHGKQDSLMPTCLSHVEANHMCMHACMHACTADIPDSSRKSGLPGANGTAVPDRLRLRSCSRESAPSCSTGAVLGGAPSGEGAPSESERTSLPDLVGRWCDRPQRWDHRWDRFHPKEGSWYHLWDERWSISQGKGHVMGVVS